MVDWSMDMKPPKFHVIFTRIGAAQGLPDGENDDKNGFERVRADFGQRLPARDLLPLRWSV
jgi:hypothetical protein